MSWQKPNGKCCLNCAYWQGVREISFGHWECNSPGDRGKCAQKVFCSVTQGQTAMQGTDCSKFMEIKAR